MGGTPSRSTAAPEEAALEEVRPLFDQIVADAEKARETGGSKAVLGFLTTALRRLDDGVTGFLSRCDHDTRVDEDILNAYYDATKKTHEAAAEVQRHVAYSVRELKRLQAAARACKVQKGDDRQAAYILEGKPLEVLKSVDTKKIGLPTWLLEKLEDAKNAYVVVINKCEEKIKGRKAEARVWIRGLVAAAAAIVVGVVVCCLAPPVGFALAASAAFTVTTETAAGVAISLGAIGIIGGGAVLTYASAHLVSLRKLVEVAEQQTVLLNDGKCSAEGLITEIIPIRRRVLQLHSKIHILAGGVQDAQDLDSLDEIIQYLRSLDSHVQELCELSKACDSLIESARKAFDDYFKKSPGFFVKRVLESKDV